ncbi:uncharacterized protein LOC100846688 [Brachypodium distachyon]|uniref:GRF-type domain-containing protein n=1 Tax=Brachypodium distachyon TaxID=15368 RepID=I1GWP8_BRADI|nr:uncharacterized protein LOC100846688 [Brachypodium distachyon]KQK17404.1 hypothetical protein BRADI_1g34230v3 [Brachypodium distachyon]|eukprot:XP_003563515.1 uncharacterized protein LOC100846688 [Brachypodium distachyon]
MAPGRCDDREETEEKKSREMISGQVPVAIDDIEYYGWEVDSKIKCFHGLLPVRKVAFDGENTGRRFIGCSCEDETSCDLLVWYDPEWPGPLKRALQQLWTMLSTQEHKIHAELDSLFRTLESGRGRQHGTAVRKTRHVDRKTILDGLRD